MLPKERVTAILSVVIFAGISSLGIPADNISHEVRRVQRSRIRELYGSIEGPGRELPRTFRTKEGYLRFLTAPSQSHFLVNQSGPASPKEEADAFLEEWRDLFGSDSPAVEFKAIEVETSKGRTYVRYQQTYAGLEVLNGQMIIQVGAGGGVELVVSDVLRHTEPLDKGEIPVEPRIDAEEAAGIALELCAEQFHQPDLEVSAPRLMIYCPSISGVTGRVQLVWQTEVSTLNRRPIREFVLVNASSGEVGMHYSLINHALNRDIRDCECNKYINCDQVCSEGDCNSSDPEVANAYLYAKDVYDFYYNEHERDLLNGNMTVLVYWKGCAAQEGSNRIEMSLGWVADDVVGHEFTHIVLKQEGISTNGMAGVITESLCDIWGEWIDQENNDGNDADWVKWMVGEDVDLDAEDCGDDCPTGCPSGTVALRYMKDPTCAGRSDICSTGADRMSSYDSSKLYYNAGIGNKLAYLLTDGDTFREHTITDMGIPKTADLYYECITNQLVPQPDYYDIANGLMRAADNLGMTQSERKNVEKACRAVEIYPESGFVVADSSGLPVAWFDDFGNVWLKGELEQSSDFSPATGHDEFQFRDSSGNLVMVIDMSNGNMYIKGTLSENQEQLTTSAQSDEFVVEDINGVVAYINDSGNLYLEGELFADE